jgi:hypothetical protein
MILFWAKSLMRSGFNQRTIVGALEKFSKHEVLFIAFDSLDTFLLKHLKVRNKAWKSFWWEKFA